jgi:phosphoadenosine phosphosulfate reductase
MTRERVNSSLNLLRLVRQHTDAIGVAVSYGKDSLATLDLCARVFPRVEGYYLYRVRNLSIVQEWSDAVFARYGIRVRNYPHFDLSRCYRHAVLQPHWRTLGKTPRLQMSDIDDTFREDANVSWIAYGWRRNDSFSRALIMKSCAGYDPRARRLFPLRSWRRQDVYAYLDERGIPRPPTLGRKEQGGLDFHTEALAALRDERPDDWARWTTDFPLSGVRFAQAKAE